MEGSFSEACFSSLRASRSSVGSKSVQLATMPGRPQVPREPVCEATAPPRSVHISSHSLRCPPGLRGAIPYALSLHLDLEPMEKRQLIGTTTIIIVLFTILLLGGSTMPLIRLMDIEDAKARRRNKKDVNLSKTEKMVSARGPWAGRGVVPTACLELGK